MKEDLEWLVPIPPLDKDQAKELLDWMFEGVSREEFKRKLDKAQKDRSRKKAA